MLDHLLAQVAADPANTKLVLMPISRVLVESVCSIGDLRILPPGAVDLNAFRPIANKTMQFSGDIAHFVGQDLREIATSLTGFDCEILAKTPLVAFVTTMDWDAFFCQDHEADIQLLRRISAIAERAFDFVRLHSCRFDLPATLPGRVGSWDGSNAFLGAMIYTFVDHESYLIAGEAIDSSIVVKGLGLDLNMDLPARLPTAADGEVAGVAIHGLLLFSDVMTASSDTIKFVRAMTLLEFLASPDEFKNWKSLKGAVICHCASSKEHYHQLAHRFKELTSLEDVAGNQIGIRTLVVHHGRFLEDIVPSEKDRRSLFRELQVFAASVLEDMLANTAMTLTDFQEFRAQKKKALGV